LGINLLNKGIQASDPVPGQVEQWSLLRHVRFQDIKVSHVATLVNARNTPVERPVDGLALVNITGTCDRAITLANAVNVELAGIAVTGFTGPLLTMEHVTGTGLANPAVPGP